MNRLILLINFVLIFACFDESQVMASETEKQRIISLAPATTEILFSLGLSENVIGVTTFCNYPPEVKNKGKIGTFSQPNVEDILFLNPDLTFATGLEQASIVQKLKQLGLKVYISYPSSLDELLNSIEEIGKLTNREKEAHDLTNQMKNKVGQIKRKVESIPEDKRPKVFVEIWHDPLMTAGSGSFVDELITLAGGINIAHDTPRAYCYFSPEQVIERNPDCIIFGYMDEQLSQPGVRNRLGWNKIKAIRNNRLYNDINPDLFLRPGPRLIEGLEKIYQKLHHK